MTTSVQALIIVTAIIVIAVPFLFYWIKSFKHR